MARTGKVKKDGFFSNDYIKRSNFHSAHDVRVRVANRWQLPQGR